MHACRYRALTFQLYPRQANTRPGVLRHWSHGTWRRGWQGFIVSIGDTAAGLHVLAGGGALPSGALDRGDGGPYLESFRLPSCWWSNSLPEKRESIHPHTITSSTTQHTCFVQALLLARPQLAPLRSLSSKHSRPKHTRKSFIYFSHTAPAVPPRRRSACEKVGKGCGPSEIPSGAAAQPPPLPRPGPERGRERPSPRPSALLSPRGPTNQRSTGRSSRGGERRESPACGRTPWAVPLPAEGATRRRATRRAKRGAAWRRQRRRRRHRRPWRRW